MPSEFSTPVLTGGLSLESEWQEVTSDLQDSPVFSPTLNIRSPTGVVILPLVSNSSNHFSKLLSTIPRALITIIISYIMILLIWDFFTQALVNGFFYWSLSDSKSPRFPVLFLVFCPISIML